MPKRCAILGGIVALLLTAARLAAGETPAASSWPEIKDPEAMVKVAREIIEREIRKKPQLSDRFPVRVEESRFAVNGPIEVSVGRNHVLIVLSDRPFTGRAFLVVPDPAKFSPITRARIEATAVPEIKRLWLELSVESNLFRCSVELRDFKHLDTESASGPLARTTPMPSFPPDFLLGGIAGRVEAQLTVKPDGTVDQIETRGELDEFKRAVLEALQQWRFVPGVDRVRRVPVATRISLTVLFTIHDP